MKLMLALVCAIGLMAFRCRGSGFGTCGAPPAGDTEAPRGAIAIEMLQGNRWVLVSIGRDSTVNIPADDRFNIVFSGNDDGFVHSLALGMQWTEWVGSLPRLVQPLVQPKLFDVACTPRLDVTRFTWQGSPRAYRFEAIAEDYAGNYGRSPQLTVVHGTPPDPIDP
jgi:hypothetical protein